jgi:hypothetical protein
MKPITVNGWLLILALASFLLSAFFLLMILKYESCGVGFFSPQVTWGDRLPFFILPAIPGVLGCAILWFWKSNKGGTE